MGRTGFIIPFFFPLINHNTFVLSKEHGWTDTALQDIR